MSEMHGNLRIFANETYKSIINTLSINKIRKNYEKEIHLYRMRLRS